MNKKTSFLSIGFLTLFTTVLHAQSQQVGSKHASMPISLHGIWNFKLDPFDTGVNSNGVQLLPQLPETIMLPGSTDEGGKGIRTQGMTSIRLTRAFEYKGAAWYEKEIYIPSKWQGKVVKLFLERAHWETQVWVNGRKVGRRESLSVPHLYDITAQAKPGTKNKIRIRVDNQSIYNLEYAHAVSAETQTNWNGIIGDMHIQAFDKVHIEDVQVYPDGATKTANVKLSIRNATGNAVTGTLHFSGHTTNNAQPLNIPRKDTHFSSKDSVIIVETELPLGPEIQRWDEFNPYKYQLLVGLTARDDSANYSDMQEATFGVRELSTQGTQFLFNGRPTFIRATVNCAEFPLTGYPPTDVEEWLRILGTCKAYGLNGMRFHTWCPPRAAFEAADQLGMYLQVENPDWRFTVGKDTAVNRFMKEEAERILAMYGNHPSFVMFCEGNEMVGPTVREFLSSQVSHWEEIDPRRLYTGSAAYPQVPESQYHVLYGARPHRWKEGLKSRFNVAPLNTQYDYSDYVTKYDVPIITHEVGQWCVYPNFDEIAKYKGVLKPYNYELFRELLRDRNMLDQAEQFTMASGKFHVILKKEEVESYLRTPGFGGYHMLQLNDFPGQGTAPVGVVDIFWDPKPYVTAEEFSTFQAAHVPLLRTESFTWTNDQTFTAQVQFANFGETDLVDAMVQWTLNYPDGTPYAKGNFPRTNIPIGSPNEIGELAIPLNGIDRAVRLRLHVQVEGADYRNQWNIWVYPKQLDDVSHQSFRIAHTWDKKTKAYLKKGETVLLLADTAAIAGNADPVFSGISWNTVWSGMPPNLLGILCNPMHPALTHFPTEQHSNWQWWDAVRHSKPLLLDHTPFGFKPIVQMIPDWNNPRKIGLIFEAKVGNGNLVVSAVDLVNNLDQRPVARQLLHSLERYVASGACTPTDELTVDMIDQLFN